MSTNRPSAIQALPAAALFGQVVIDLDHGNAGSFITTFKEALATSPGRYMRRHNS